jgi:alkylation response protein AidB-like acyl-CoA dehydrogenase
MQFDLSSSQYLMRETLQRFLSNDFTMAQVREVSESPSGWDERLWQSYADFGLLGLFVPEQFGGLGLEMLDAASASEVLGYAAAPGPFVEHLLATMALALGGSDEQKLRWLPKLAAGEARGTIAITEGFEGLLPFSSTLHGSDPLTGSKQAVLYPADADVMIVLTTEGFTLVEGSADGITVTPLDGIDRTRRIADVTFYDVNHELLGGGMELVETVTDAGLVLLAADAYGAGLRLLEMSVEYAKQREQFGVTIGHFQALKHQLANAALEIHPSRYLYFYAAHAFDQLPEERSKYAALAKSHISERAVGVGRVAVEAHGGIGYTWEADVHFFLKRAIFDRAYFGCPVSLRERVALLNEWVAA